MEKNYYNILSFFGSFNVYIFTFYNPSLWLSMPLNLYTYDKIIKVDISKDIDKDIYVYI